MIFYFKDEKYHKKLKWDVVVKYYLVFVVNY